MALKSYRNLYPQIGTWDNLYEAWRKARKGKRGQEPAASFEYQSGRKPAGLAERAARQDLTGLALITPFYIHEPKRRLISAAPFRDRVVHHALCNVIEPLFERTFIYDSYANAPARARIRRWIAASSTRAASATCCSAMCANFFPAIDHALLRARLARVIADRDVLALIDLILESGAGVLSDEYEMV